MSEIELILTKLKIVSEEKENGMYLCDKKHSKILLDYIQQKENIIKEVREKVMNIKEINEIYKQTDMLERFYSRKWCNDEMDNFLEILDREEK